MLSTAVNTVRFDSICSQ